MRWKESLTPLDAVPELDETTREKLAAHHITTAEELVGQIEAEPESVGNILEQTEPDVRELGRRARQVIDPGVADEMERQRGRERKLGALPPDDESS
jgi:hypothetical protein